VTGAGCLHLITVFSLCLASGDFSIAFARWDGILMVSEWSLSTFSGELHRGKSLEHSEGAVHRKQ
jgi:hypothetical protein